MSKIARFFWWGNIFILMFGSPTTVPVGVTVANAAANTYYVSSSTGSDSNVGSESMPFATIAKVNSLNLQPGDRVLFKCGDTWRATPLYITKSGAAGLPLTFGSYPASCANRPIFSGAQPISGWVAFSTNIYVANLSTEIGRASCRERV